MDKESIEKEQKEVLQDVTEILAKDENTRNSDLWLCIQFWRKKGIRVYVNYADLDKMTTPETITRVRRIIQNNQGQYLPTNPETLYRRKVKEELLRQYFSNQPNIIAKWQDIRSTRQQ